LMRCSIGSAELILAQSIRLANPLSDRQLSIFNLRHLAEAALKSRKWL